jgi:hypothetical protein
LTPGYNRDERYKGGSESGKVREGRIENERNSECGTLTLLVARFVLHILSPFFFLLFDPRLKLLRSEVVAGARTPGWIKNNGCPVETSLP